MADEKRSNSAPANRPVGGEGRGQRRYFWRKKRGQKTGSETPEPKEQKEQKEQSSNSKRTSNRAAPPASEKVDRNQRTKRRRRPRSRQGGLPDPKVIAPPPVMEDSYVPPASVFIYTHVVRPEQRDSYEFRSEHFSKISRQLEDFDIDLSILFPDENAPKIIEKAPAMEWDYGTDNED